MQRICPRRLLQLIDQPAPARLRPGCQRIAAEALEGDQRIRTRRQPIIDQIPQRLLGQGREDVHGVGISHRPGQSHVDHLGTQTGSLILVQHFEFRIEAGLRRMPAQ